MQNYILCCAFVIVTQWFSTLNNFLFLFWARPFVNYFVPNISCMYGSIPSWIFLNPQFEFCINYFPTGDFVQLVSNSSRVRREDSRERMNSCLCWRNRRFVRVFVMYSCSDENSKITWSGARGLWCLSRGL